ncbi:MAG: AAA family ATPase [Gemmatimonadetes bacterium]|nr:AAA family ATPase [Gemmatimonadota bacterium]
MRELIDRERELAELQALADEPAARLALLYGWRRVGKTFLLKRAWEGRRHFYFLAANTTPDQNRQDFVRELGAWAGDRLEAEDYPTWRAAFRLLARFAREAPLVVVLDEFQYLLGVGDTEGVVSQLNAVWEQELSGTRLTLVLCGSEVGTMEGLAVRGALYGRIDWSARLGPFDYFDAGQMTRCASRREDAYVYGVFGGVARYLESVREGKGLDRAVIEAMLSPRGSVHLQLENLIEQEEAIREPGQYRAVLAAVAQGRTELNEIAQAAGLQRREHVVRRVLGVLEDLHILIREQNFAAGRTAPWRHRIGDNAVKFWYRFVHPNRSILETEGGAQVWSKRVKPRLDDYMGWRTFEDMARQAYSRHHARWGLPDAVHWARWEGLDRNRRQIEIDLIAELDGRKLLAGEVKWSSRRVDESVHELLLRNLYDLTASGQQWARRALDPRTSHGYMYVSAAGFTEAFRARAEQDRRIQLIDLEDIYRSP